MGGVFESQSEISLNIQEIELILETRDHVDNELLFIIAF